LVDTAKIRTHITPNQISLYSHTSILEIKREHPPILPPPDPTLPLSFDPPVFEMAKNIWLAWAILIDPVTLVARLEAYKACKETTLDFRSYVELAGGRAVGRLPPEMMTMIQAVLQELEFEDCFKSVKRAQRRRELPYKIEDRLSPDQKQDASIRYAHETWPHPGKHCMLDPSFWADVKGNPFPQINAARESG